MNCSFCGLEFEEISARHQCQGCLLAGGCRSIRCPRCGYEMPEEPKLPEWLNYIKRTVMNVLSLKSNSSPKSYALAARKKAPNISIAYECHLAEMHPGQIGTVIRIHSRDGKELQKLLALGVLPGLTIRLKRKSPSFVFEAGYSEFAIDSRIADAVMVRVA